MKKLASTIFILFLLSNINAQNPQFLENIIIIKIKNQTNSNNIKVLAIENIKKSANGKIYNIAPMFKNFNREKQKIPNQYDLSKIYKITLHKNNNFNAILQSISKLNEIIYAEPYPISVVFDEPNDPYINNQYYLQNIKAFEAYNYSTGDTNIVIGIVDSGVDLLHEDLKDNYKYNYNDPINNIDDDMDGFIDNFYGWDVADNNSNPQSLVNENGQINYHGTKVSGMAAATTNNSIGIAGIGYKTKILPIKAMDASGRIVAGYEGIIYAADHGCDIINCSWGSNYASQFAQDVINYAALYKNCLVVAAAGNKNASVSGRPDELWYPASYKNVLSVAATGPDDTRWYGSSYATTVDVSAPGENVFSTNQNNTYSYGYGTSYAAPLVAGLAGLLKAQRPELTQQQLLEQIRITSDNIDTLPNNIYYSKQLGYGRINALKTLTTNDMPSVRIDSLNIIANINKPLIAGDTLKVTFAVTNILAQATNTTIKLSTNSNYLVPINNFFSTGKLETFEWVNNHTNPLLIKVKPEIPNNEKVWFIFEIIAEGYEDYQVFEIYLNRNYIDINKNKIATTLTSTGKLGFVNKNEKLGLGFIYENNNNFLNYGGIMVGNSSSTMASALFDVEEFNTIKTIDTLQNTANELIGKTTYTTLQETGLNIDITQTTIASTKEQMQSTLLHLYKLQNNTDNTIENIKMSQFIDWDLYSDTNNRTGFDDNLNLFYTYSTGNSIIYAGICLLNNISSTPYGFDLVDGGNGGIDITNGFNNELKWFTMTNSRQQAGNSGDTINIATMLTTDFFIIAPNDSVEIAFAQIIGNNYNDLINKTKAVINTYRGTSIHNKLTTKFNIFPNPANNELTIQNFAHSQNTTISIYDESGRVQFAKNYNNSISIKINIDHLEPGIYIVNCITDTEQFSAKFIKVP